MNKWRILKDFTDGGIDFKKGQILESDVKWYDWFVEKGLAERINTKKEMNIVDKFFTKKLITNENTKRCYEQGVKHYFKAIGKNPDTYFHNGHDIEKDIGDYFLSLQKYTPWTQKVKMNSLKQFLITFDRDIRDYEIWETISLRLKGTDAITGETPLDKTDIKKILQYGDLCAKAMFTIMASSGCRIESVVGLLPSDIHDNETPTRIVFRPEIVKGKKRSVTSFISKEATEYYQAWMKIRNEYLASAVKRSTFHKKNADDKRVFPMSDVNARLIWRGMVEKAGYDERDAKTNRLMCHPHSLRKFFRSWLGNVDLSEHLMGHRGYLSTYRQYDYKQLSKEYMKYVSNLLIFETENKDVTDIREQLSEKDKAIEEMKKEIMEFRLTQVELKQQIEALKEKK